MSAICRLWPWPEASGSIPMLWPHRPADDPGGFRRLPGHCRYACIAVLHRLESGPEKPSPRAHTFLVAATQFALGALLSGFCVFYIRSASIGASWPFLLFMAAIFVGNEYFRAYTSRLVFAALLFFFSLYSYAILLVPVAMARIGSVSFLISGALAVAVFFLYAAARFHGT